VGESHINGDNIGCPSEETEENERRRKKKRKENASKKAGFRTIPNGHHYRIELEGKAPLNWEKKKGINGKGGWGWAIQCNGKRHICPGGTPRRASTWRGKGRSERRKGEEKK